MFAIKTTIAGLPQLYGTLRALDKKLAKKTLRAAMNDAGKIVLKAAKTLVPKDTGALKSSLAVKIVVKDERVTAVVGPRRTRGTVGRGANRKKNQLTSFGKSKVGQKAMAFGREPVRYAHLVEFGTRGMRGVIISKGDTKKNKSGKRQKKRARRNRSRKGAQPFLRPAIDGNAGIIKVRVRLMMEQALRNVGVV